MCGHKRVYLVTTLFVYMGSIVLIAYAVLLCCAVCAYHKPMLSYEYRPLATVLTQLDEGTEVKDVEVLREDQNRINRFSSLNTQMDHLEDDEKEASTSKEYLDDLIMEMELMDEDEIVKFKIGDAFVDIPQSEAMERLEKQQEDVDAKLSKSQDSMAKIREEMEELKKHLYAKFGNSISLER